MPEVSSASLTWSVPDGVGSGTTPLYAAGKDSSQSVLYESVIADKKYLEAFQIPIMAGRTFEQASDSLNIVINESAVKTLGLHNAADAIGQRLFSSADLSFNVIGVFSDFHFGSMKDKIRPMILTNVNFNNAYRLMCFKLKPGNIGGAMEKLQSKWSALLPATSFDYKFMDESLQQLYRTEIQLKKASQVATALALFIVVLGIIGLISLSIQKRTKEIGIRKLLGASVSNIASLFMKDFLPVVLISGIISIPVSWFIMQKWLNDYNYRISITAEPFALSIIGLGVLAALLIVIQIFKASLQNPSKSLRTE
jgi:ABC-type antimicrobial peptide transport system permease subunit